MVGSTFAKILDKHCLEGHNFPSWYRNVKILLTLEKIIYVLDKPLPDIPLGPEATEDERAKYDKHVEDDTQAKCYLLASMNEELQRQHEGMDSAFSIILHLTELYGEGTRNRRFNTVCELVKTKMVKGAPVSNRFKGGGSSYMDVRNRSTTIREDHYPRPFIEPYYGSVEGHVVEKIPFHAVSPSGD
ncbi:uncharacterized protein LOC103943722 [Pyrus x bretschneideri]|uniref:uncharacterized protein LOC103943722 n=1 Tax=Pyrus x bretschneideri TaxID=225117 RepID=UPI0020303C52|nr:uncharacterized protein LOC103943722 [Pyrus x bretschneideri]